MPVFLIRGPGCLQLQSDVNIVIGSLDARYSAIFNALLEESAIYLQALIVPFRSSDIGDDDTQSSVKAAASARTKRLALLVNVYGPMDLFDLIGDYLSHCSENLQPPSLCDRNVPYRNPQSLSGRDEEPPMTFHFRADAHLNEIELVEQDSDPSAALETQITFAESPVPVAIRTPLYG